VPATSTLERLDGLLAKGVLHREDHEYLQDAFRFISHLLLRQQIEDFQAGSPISDFVPEPRLSKREKDHLVSCFRAIGNVRGTLPAELTATAF
jgi:CBS domain-containing protein